MLELHWLNRNKRLELGSGASRVISLAIKHFEQFPLTSLAWMFLLHRLCFVRSCVMWLISVRFLPSYFPRWMLNGLTSEIGYKAQSVRFLMLLYSLSCVLLCVEQQMHEPNPTPPHPSVSKCSLLCNNWHDTKMVPGWLIHTLYPISTFLYCAWFRCVIKLGLLLCQL